MIETILFMAGVATLGVGAGAAGWIAGKKRGTSVATLDIDERLAALATQRDAAERRARDAQNESSRWKALSLAGQTFAAAATYDERPSPLEAEELTRLLRGLHLVDDVVLSDATGLSLTREEARSSGDLAAIAPHVLKSSRRMALSALSVVQLSFETFGADHVCARPLVGRFDGALLLVRTTSQRANPLAIDAVVHASARTTAELGVVSAAATSLATSGSSDRFAPQDSHLATVFGALDREIDEDVRSITLAVDGAPVYSAAKNGPSEATRRAVSGELASLQARVAHTLRALGMARMEVALRGGDTLTWSSLGPRSRLSVITLGRSSARSGARLDRLLGVIRRGAGSGDRVVVPIGSIPPSRRQELGGSR